MNRHLLLLYAAVIVMVITACAPPINLLDETKLKDDSLVTGDPCEAPCWNDIIPGETKFRDAKIVIEDDGRFAKIETQEDDESDARMLQFAYGDADLCCQMFTEEGEIVDSLLLYLAPEVTLGQILDKYGDPTYVLGEELAEEQAVIYLFYPDIPLVLYAFVPGAAEGELSESSEIISALYLEESLMQRIIDGSQLYNWEGYQSFADYVDENYDFVGPDYVSEEDAAAQEAESDETESD